MNNSCFLISHYNQCKHDVNHYVFLGENALNWYSVLHLSDCIYVFATCLAESHQLPSSWILLNAIFLLLLVPDSSVLVSIIYVSSFACVHSPLLISKLYHQVPILLHFIIIIHKCNQIYQLTQHLLVKLCSC